MDLGAVLAGRAATGRARRALASGRAVSSTVAGLRALGEPALAAARAAGGPLPAHPRLADPLHAWRVLAGNPALDVEAALAAAVERAEAAASAAVPPGSAGPRPQRVLPAQSAIAAGAAPPLGPRSSHAPGTSREAARTVAAAPALASQAAGIAGLPAQAGASGAVPIGRAPAMPRMPVPAVTGRMPGDGPFPVVHTVGTAVSPTPAALAAGAGSASTGDASPDPAPGLAELLHRWGTAPASAPAPPAAAPDDAPLAPPERATPGQATGDGGDPPTLPGEAVRGRTTGDGDAPLTPPAPPAPPERATPRRATGDGDDPPTPPGEAVRGRTTGDGGDPPTLPGEAVRGRTTGDGGAGAPHPVAEAPAEAGGALPWTGTTAGQAAAVAPGYPPITPGAAPVMPAPTAGAAAALTAEDIEDAVTELLRREAFRHGLEVGAR